MFVGEGDQSLTGYRLEITVRIDLTGRPMRPDLDGSGVKIGADHRRDRLQGR